ncbi:coatomer subunit beta'-2-like [Vigna angularis]|uniref:coatomer subunit beta'-2-like n=1 Tax=Phaseolus angularis TaxID=3914 RepID=UPI0022B53544|nr:coatomer subunit beta'-2-like [Vigna angularis]
MCPPILSDFGTSEGWLVDTGLGILWLGLKMTVSGFVGDVRNAAATTVSLKVGRSGANSIAMVMEVARRATAVFVMALPVCEGDKSVPWPNLLRLLSYQIWNLGSPDPNFTLDAHQKGVNCVDYFTGGDKPYLITGSDDHTAKVWDYQTKGCVQTLDGHTHNVSAVCFHPELPIIITGSEDGTVRIWHSTTYRLENTLNYGLERVWAIGYLKGSRRVVIGYDEGTIMVKLGREVPVASMDNSGKIIWAKHNEIQTVNIKGVGADVEIADGERLPLAVKELGTCDLYPQKVAFVHDLAN